MKETNEIVVEHILNQAKIFLVELGDFAPFGSALDKDRKFKPLGAFVDDEAPQPLKIIELLEKHITKMLSSEEFLIAAIAIDVLVSNQNRQSDGIEIRIFEKDKQYKKYVSYTIEDKTVEFNFLNL